MSRRHSCPHCHRTIAPLTPAERSATHKAKQTALNDERRLRGVCTWCETPTELNARTGRPKALCPVHLAAMRQNKLRRKLREARVAAHWAAEQLRKRA